MNTPISAKTKARLRPSPWDALVVLAVTALAAGLFFLLLPKGTAAGELTCTISQDGQVLDTFPITAGMADEERVYGAYTVEISHGYIRIETAPCANQDCVHTGRIHRNGQSIVCLPGRFVVELSAADGAEPDIDIVVK